MADRMETPFNRRRRRVLNNNSEFGIQLVGGSVYIKSANRLMHEGEWTCHVYNSLTMESEQIKIHLIVTGIYQVIKV